MEGNREYKSDVFSMLMEDKKYALEVYNALNHTDYQESDALEIYNLEPGVSLSIRNDAAFLVNANLNLYEHQSSVCPNIPLRCLFYVAKMLWRLSKDKNLYGRAMIRIPEPKFVVFYNGTEKLPEQSELKLSNAFEKRTGEPQLEVTCIVYNINRGRNQSLLKDCKILEEYAIFVDYVRQYQQQDEERDIRYAIEAAIDRCIQEDILKNFLTEKRGKVIKVMEMDFTFGRQLELERQAAIEEGREQGREEGREEGIAIFIRDHLTEGKSREIILEKLVRCFSMTPEKAAAHFERTIQEKGSN